MVCKCDLPQGLPASCTLGHIECYHDDENVGTCRPGLAHVALALSQLSLLASTFG